MGTLKKLYSYVLDTGTCFKIGRCTMACILIDYAIRSGAPMEVIENLQDIEDDEEIFESIEDIWPDYPSKDDFFFNEDEY